MKCTDNKELDPITELYDIASALHFLEDALTSHGESDREVRTDGAAYVTGLVGHRINAIACALWELESKLQQDAASSPHGQTIQRHAATLAPQAGTSPNAA